MARFWRLLLVAPVVVAALRHRSTPDEAEADDEEEEGAATALYLTKDAKEWTAQQIEEELTTNFTQSETFQTRLHRWCKRDSDHEFCLLKNTLTHYCPTLYKAAPELVNRSVLVEDMLEFLKLPAKEAWSREGLTSNKELQDLLHITFLQVDTQGFPTLRKKKADDGEKEERKHSHTTAVEREHTEQLEREDKNKLAEVSLSNPFPEVVKTQAYADRVNERCSAKSTKRIEACRMDAKASLLCLAASKAVVKHHDIGTVSLKMQEMMKTLPELNFKL